MKGPLALVLAALLCGCAQGTAEAEPRENIALRATPIPIQGGRLDGLRLLGATELSSDKKQFGGFSGLWMEDGHMIAVSDIGWVLLADVDGSAGHLRPVRPRYIRMRGEGGGRLNKTSGDAESLTLSGDRLKIGFERDHRIMTHQRVGRLGRSVRHRGWERAFTSNKGLEALATLPGGNLLALGEAHADGLFRMYQIDPDGRVTERALPALSRHFATGADVGPDGRLYLLLRDYSLLAGVSARILRYELDADGWPIPETVRQMGRFGSSSGIDNMEGIALWRDGAGRVHMTLISDDNFRSLQRTILVDLEVLDDPVNRPGG